jgi:hypothetical protein
LHMKSGSMVSSLARCRRTRLVSIDETGTKTGIRKRGTRREA